MHELVIFGMVVFTALIFGLYIFDAAQEYSERTTSNQLALLSTAGFIRRFILLPTILLLGELLASYFVPDYTILVSVVIVFVFSTIRYTDKSIGGDILNRGNALRDFSIWRKDYRPTRIIRLVSAVIIVILGVVWVYISPNRDKASDIFWFAISPPIIFVVATYQFQDLLGTIRFFLGDERKE